MKNKWKCLSCDSEELPIYMEVVDEYKEYPIVESNGIYIRSNICDIHSSDSREHPRETYIKCSNCYEMYTYGIIIYADEAIDLEDIES